MKTIGEIISAASAEAIALRAPEQPPLQYDGLVRFVAEIGGKLRQNGVARDQRVAIVLPNGPQMASAFLAVANACIAAPLNPGYKQDEFDFYLRDLKAALLITDDIEGPAAEAAKALGVAVARVSTPDNAEAGIFSLDLPDSGILPLNDASPADEALVLHTSGTTSRPKIVPLSQANVASSAFNVATSLELKATDVCLNVMPLFHIHGLIAAVLSSLRAGASIYCTPGFNALKVFGWLSDANPTWYTAVPTMHQAILSRKSRNLDTIGSLNLRLVRSSSSSLPPQVMAELEDTFGCPVVEAYGMTEAAHQMTCNPIARGAQKPGSVGVAAGPDVQLLIDSGFTQQPEMAGEVVIRGDNVTAGYEANETANRESFLNDPDGNGSWFRTGDQGIFDADGFLTITGRLKEIINRGGEKISPREVDEVLLDHPVVAQAVTFAVPHEKLGEEVAAVIVAKEGVTPDTKQIRSFLTERLANFKVPKQILVIDEIPKGATGKLQRIGLHKKLGIGAAE
ncbi:AMP-binding protein [Shimia sediminis]|uniref:AMP-binding protein n=1 Tax=Shimia sediminis TaxID=2497945 RepID=UPI000F8D4D3B|nr:AMP-binding protein [Shimia sediminis]